MDECDKPSHFVLKTCAEQELTPLGQDEVLDMEVDNETRDLVKAAAAVTTTNTPVTNSNTDVSSTTKASTSQPGHSLRTLSLPFKEIGEKLTAKLANIKK